MPNKRNERQLIIIRHAHREKPRGGMDDNGLSAKGHLQAKQLCDFYEHSFGTVSPFLLSSPKKRCLETVRAIADLTGAPLQIDPRLDEGGDMEHKLRAFRAWWISEKAPDHVVACSHGDWIPEFLQLTTGNFIDLEKAGWVELNYDAQSATIQLHKVFQTVPETT